MTTTTTPNGAARSGAPANASVSRTAELAAAAGLLTAPYVLEYTYRRSTGPVIGAFLTGLRDGKILGAKLPDGRVMVPAKEYDPATGAAIAASDLVEVGDAGVITTWSWVSDPQPHHPLSAPFAWALVKLDGADTAWLHVVDAASPDDVRSGLRVTARWAGERVGSVRDILAFTPER